MFSSRAPSVRLPLALLSAPLGIRTRVSGSRTKRRRLRQATCYGFPGVASIRRC
jgi:hypothetical protein